MISRRQAVLCLVLQRVEQAVAMRVDADRQWAEAPHGQPHQAVMRDEVAVGDFAHGLDRRRMQWRAAAEE